MGIGLRRTPAIDPGEFRNWPSHAVARVEFRQLLARDVRLLFVFSGGFADRFLHPRQFRWAYGPDADDPRVCMHYWPDCDHTYYGVEQRTRLIARIADWLDGLHKQGA